MSYEARKPYNINSNVLWVLRNTIDSMSSEGKLSKDDKSRVESLFAVMSNSGMLSDIPPSPRNRIIWQIKRIQNSKTKRSVRDNLIALYRLFRIYRLDYSDGLPRQSLVASNNSRAVEELSSRIKELEQQVNSPKINPESPESEVQEITLSSLKGKQILFGIMPFGIEFDDVWEGAIKRAANSSGFYPLRVDMLTESSNITDDIMEAIKISKLIVVDVSNNNPNVMFEFGYALALKKSPIVISRSTDQLPFDIQNIRTIFYQNNWRGIEKLREGLQKFIKGTDKSKVKKPKNQ